MSQATTWGVQTEGPADMAAISLRIMGSLNALLSQHSGPEEPAYAVVGTPWIDTSESPYPVKIKGTSAWVTWAHFDPVGGTFALVADTEIDIEDVTGLEAAIAALVPATRSISAAGLATGGGALSADRTITVPKASQGTAEAGLNDTDAMTALKTAQAIAAQATLNILANALSTTRGAVLFRGASAWDDLPPGTAGQALTSGGAGADVSWGDVGGKNMTIQVITATGDWTRPTGCTKVLAVAIGGGGGGGGADNASGSAGGGGSGACAIALVTSPAATVACTIGAAGSNGNASGSDGGDGGSTSFGAHAVAGGGFGGDGVTGAGQAGRAGAGGSASAGTIQLGGNDGGEGHGWISGSTSLAPSGYGAGSILGGAARGATFIGGGGAGEDGGAPGAGGSGGSTNSTTGKAGGNGVAGRIYVFEFYGSN